MLTLCITRPYAHKLTTAHLEKIALKVSVWSRGFQPPSRSPLVFFFLWWGRLTALRAIVSPFLTLLMQGVFCYLRSFSCSFEQHKPLILRLLRRCKTLHIRSNTRHHPQQPYKEQGLQGVTRMAYSPSLWLMAIGW